MAGRVLVAVVSIVVLAVTGLAWRLGLDLHGLASSSAIAADAAKSQDGAVNILVMGLTTRLDQNGEPLPQDVLDALHAGDGSAGGYNTNTMIVLHVPNDGSKVMAVSVPRDDYVDFADAPDGQKSGKIKEAYGLAKDQEWNRLYNQGVTDHNTLEQLSREAGRKSTITNLTKLLGVPIDHFMEISLAGFYDLASQLGGVDVCLNHATEDSKSGANFPAGRQHLDGAQALAFVRQRDNLANADLDRTHRQQAFLSSVTKKLKDQGVFGSIGRMQDLLAVAKKDVVADQSWDLLSYGQQAQGLTGGNVEFHTLPIKGYGKIAGSDVNLIDVAQVQAVTRTLFKPPKASTAVPGATPTTTTPPPAQSRSTVDVRNGSGQEGAAGRLADALAAKGFTKGQTTTIDPQPVSQVFYGQGGSEDAGTVAHLLGGLPVSASPAAEAQHVIVYLGQGFTMPDSLQAASATSGTPSTTVIPTEGPQGGAVVGGDVPCVD
jgi:LCP family protein required for cell wall assembly